MTAHTGCDGWTTMSRSCTRAQRPTHPLEPPRCDVGIQLPAGQTCTRETQQHPAVRRDFPPSRASLPSVQAPFWRCPVVQRQCSRICQDRVTHAQVSGEAGGCNLSGQGLATASEARILMPAGRTSSGRELLAGSAQRATDHGIASLP